jgi:hypothetical protein
MKPHKHEEKYELLRREEDKQRPRFRPAIERLEERISPSGIFPFLGQAHGNHYHGGHGYPA